VLFIFSLNPVFGFDEFETALTVFSFRLSKIKLGFKNQLDFLLFQFSFSTFFSSQ